MKLLPRHLYAGVLRRYPKFAVYGLLGFIIAFTTSMCDNPVDPIADFHNKILFTSSRSGVPQLFMMNPDGSGIKQLSSGSFWHSNGRWSPDASRIVCNTGENFTTSGALMAVMDPLGGNRRLLPEGNLMSWAPDGRRVLFTFCPLCEAGAINAYFYSIDVDGGEVVELSRTVGGRATFSPDGSRMAVSSRDLQDTTEHTTIWVMEYPSLDNLTKIGPKDAVHPDWSPDGSAIAFSMNPDTTGTVTLGYELYVLWLSDSTTTRITHHETPEHYLNPRWSSDGKQLIFIAFSTDGSSKYYLSRINNDGTGFVRLLDDGSVTSADWSR